MSIFPKFEKFFLWVGSLAALMLVGCAGLLVFWLIDRDPPLKAVSGEFLGWDTDVPRRGHVVWRGLQTRTCEGTIYRYIVNGEIVTLEPRKWDYRGPIENPHDEPTTWDAAFDLPPHLNHDAAYRNRIEFRCNPLHKMWPIVVPAADVPFELREEDKQPNYVSRPDGLTSHGQDGSE